MTEKILVCLAIIAVIMKLLSIPFNGILITFALTLLGIVYQIFGFALLNNIGFRGIFKGESYKSVKPIHIVFAVLSGCALFPGVIGILFVMQKWEGAFVMFMTGALSLIMILPFAVVMAIRKVDVGKNVLWRMMPLLLLYGFFYFYLMF